MMKTWTQAWRTKDLGNGSTNTKPQADEDHRPVSIDRLAKVGVSSNILIIPGPLIVTGFK